MLNPFYVLVRTGFENNQESEPKREYYFHSQLNAIKMLCAVVDNMPSGVTCDKQSDTCYFLTGSDGKAVKLEVVKATDEEIYLM